ncbi:hypothetical protein DICVIV_05577 [Dictyocaulus viviparus]|uniref:Aspartate dehydrogenase domain-containing protein n=1 Tax=Dictyocaulus viviparus TaxID=29172 RepID=A0A0D8Y163_DICVI|nr:hypothetical protein DICVIV_05577 [Dictyocaulus viviparus]
MTKHPSSFKLESPLREINDIVKANNSDAVALYEGPVRALCQLAPNNVNTMAGGAIAAHNLGFDGVIAKLKQMNFCLRMSDWHIVEVEAVGPDGFSVTTKRKNPAKPGAVTGQLTYHSFLASIKGEIALKSINPCGTRYAMTSEFQNRSINRLDFTYADEALNLLKIMLELRVANR